MTTQSITEFAPLTESNDPFADPRTDEEKRASVEGWIEFAPCEGYAFGGWEKAHVHPFDDTRSVMVRKPRLFASPGDAAPADAPGDDCPDHGPYGDDECPKCECGANATVPVYIAGRKTPLCSACYARAFTYTAHPVCHCGAIATIWDERYFCSAHYLELPSPTLYCASCLCIADDLGEGRWRCRNLACGSVARLDDLLTTSELIKRCAALERIKVAVFARLKALPDIALGRELCALRWQKFSSFVAMLVNAPEARLQHYARCYVAFVRDYNPESDMTEARVLREWQRLIDGDGPAAPALALRAA